MSKKINNNDDAINATISLREYFEKYNNVSLRKLAVATNSTYGILLKRSKQPIIGETYDPDATNYAAIEEYFTKKNIDLSQLDWDALNETTARGNGLIVKDMDKFEVGMKVYLRKHPTTPYTVCYKTATHIVIMLDGTSEPIAWSNNTFLLSGPQFQPRAEKAESEKVEEE